MSFSSIVLTWWNGTALYISLNRDVCSVHVSFPHVTNPSQLYHFLLPVSRDYRRTSLWQRLFTSSGLSPAHLYCTIMQTDQFRGEEITRRGLIEYNEFSGAYYMVLGSIPSRDTNFFFVWFSLPRGSSVTSPRSQIVFLFCENTGHKYDICGRWTLLPNYQKWHSRQGHYPKEILTIPGKKSSARTDRLQRISWWERQITRHIRSCWRRWCRKSNFPPIG